MSTLTFPQLEQAWDNAGGPPAQAATAAAIAEAESGGNLTAVNNTAYPSLPGYHPVAAGDLPEYSVGPWQINLLAHPGSIQTLETPTGAAAAAVSVYRGRGDTFNAWSTFTSNAYLSHFPAGAAGAIGTGPGPGPTSPPISGGTTPATAATSSGGGVVSDVEGSFKEMLIRGAEVLIGLALAWLALKQLGNTFARGVA